MKEETKQKLNLFGERLNSFIQSDWWIAFNVVLVFVGWISGGWFVLLPILVTLNVLPLFFFKETKHLLTLILSFTFIISDNRHHLDNYAWMLAFVLLLFVGMVFSLVRFKRDYSPLHPKRIKGFHATLIALAIPFAFAGVTTSAQNPLARIVVLALIILSALGYTFFYVTLKGDADKTQVADYVIKVLFCLGVAIALQAVYYYATTFHSFDELKTAIMDKNIKLGWGGPNNVAPVLSMTIPATLYLCLKRNKAVPILVFFALFEYLLIFCTGCRGAILFTTIAMPVMLLYVMGKTENKVLFASSVCVLLTVAIILLGLFGEHVSPIFTRLLDRGFDSSGRTEGVYPEALELFKRFPIFGAGWDYNLGEMAHDNYSPYWYHSTVLQILADMGIVGAIAFAFFYFHRYRTFLVLRKKPQAVAIFFSLVLFDAYGMIDTNFFGPSFFILLLVLSLAVELELPDDKCRAFGGRDPIADLKALLTKLSKHKHVSALESSDTQPENPRTEEDNEETANE